MSSKRSATPPPSVSSYVAASDEKRNALLATVTAQAEFAAWSPMWLAKPAAAEIVFRATRAVRVDEATRRGEKFPRGFLDAVRRDERLLLEFYRRLFLPLSKRDSSPLGQRQLVLIWAIAQRASTEIASTRVDAAVDTVVHALTRSFPDFDVELPRKKVAEALKVWRNSTRSLKEPKGAVEIELTGGPRAFEKIAEIVADDDVKRWFGSASADSLMREWLKERAKIEKAPGPR